MITDVPSVLAAAKVWRLASRTYATEIDEPFYRALQRLATAPWLREGGFAPLDPDSAMDDAQLLTAFAVEYCRLFIGPDPVCPPYGSLRQGGAYLGGRALRFVDSFLDRYNLRVDLPVDAPILTNDHISVAFSLLDKLYTTAAGHAATPLPPHEAAAAARRLLDEYLRNWAPQFLDDVEVNARQTPYRNIARLTALVLTQNPPIQQMAKY